MEFGVLGPLSVTTARGEVDIGGARQRRLLAALLADAGQIVPLDRLTDMVFEGDPPRGATTTMRSYVARLRRALTAADDAAGDLVVTEQRGYGLRIEMDHLDAARFEASIEMARSNSPTAMRSGLLRHFVTVSSSGAVMPTESSPTRSGHTPRRRDWTNSRRSPRRN